MSVQSFWVKDDDNQIYVSYYPGGQHRSSILIAPPIGPVYMHSKATLRKLALKLASNGYTSWLFDWPGYGNSSAMLPIEDTAKKYANTLQSLSTIIQERSGCKPMLVTLCSSSLIAYKVLQKNYLSAWVQWYPYSQGASFVRDLELIDATVLDTDKHSDLITAGGYPILRKDADQYSALKLSCFVPMKAIPILCIHGPESKRQTFLKNYEEQGCSISKHVSSELPLMARQAEHSIPAIQDISYIVDWFNKLVPPPSGSAKISLPYINHVTLGVVTEDIIRLGKRHLFGILTTPIGISTQHCLIIPNTGAGHHAGPNGLHTLMARKLAEQGLAVLRFDLQNLGDSGAEYDSNNNDAYTEHASENIAEYVNEFLQQRFSKISIFGLCSGAYSAFQYVLSNDNDRIIKLFLVNVNTLYWRPGEDTVAPEDAQKSIEGSYYKSQARNMKAWLGLLMSPNKWLRAVGKLVMINRSILARLQRAVFGTSTQLEKDIINIVQRDIQLHFYFNKEEPGIEMLKNNTGDTFLSLIKRNKVKVSISAGGDHTFTSIKARLDLIDAIIKEL